MSLLPGLGLSNRPHNTLQSSPAREIVLPAGSEWRFEVSFANTLTVKLLPGPPPPPNTNSPSSTASTDANTPSAGTAEIFGSELVPSRPYEFSGTKAAVHTHTGAVLSVEGGPADSDYVSEETPVPEYLNLHFALENMRNNAGRARPPGSDADAGGPRVLVLGPEDSGKTSLVKTLASWAARMGRSPLVVNLDSKEPMLCLAGSVSATVLGAGGILDVEDAVGGGWGSSPIAGPSASPIKVPLVYHFGFEGAEQRPEVFKPVCTRLALAATSRFEEDQGVKEAGLLVDTGGSVTTAKGGYDIIQHVVSEFSINVILVLGSERLHNDLSKRFSNVSTIAGDEPIHILRPTKSGGVVDRDDSYVKLQRSLHARQYFFGGKKMNLSPHTLTVEFDAVSVFRYMDASESSASLGFLPGGAEDGDDGTTADGSSSAVPIQRATPSPALEHAMLAIKHASAKDSLAAIRDASVIGYVYVTDVDVARSRMKLLSPVGGRLPGGVLVQGVWPDGWGNVVGG